MIYDSIIIGGGPAGLSAAIYLARFNRHVLVIDNENGRWNTYEINENYLGFPEGISARELRKLGIKQAKKFGAEIVIDTILKIAKQDRHFLVIGADRYESKTIILATGVTDNFPEFDKWKECLGKSLFWCITCDGHKAENKKVIVVGKTDSAIATAMQLLNFTDAVTFITNCPKSACEISDEFLKRLQDGNIPFHYGKIETVKSLNGMLSKVILTSDEEIEADMIFNQQGAVPKSELAEMIGVETNKIGYVLADVEQRTNVKGVYAAGDITKEFAHQIVTAAHEGSMAAQAVNYDLYSPDQKED